MKITLGTILMLSFAAANAAQTSELLVVTSSPPWLWLVQNVVKGVPVRVETLAEPNDSAHYFTMTPSKMRDLLSADVVVINELDGNRILNFEKISELRGTQRGIIAVNRIVAEKDLLYSSDCALSSREISHKNQSEKELELKKAVRTRKCTPIGKPKRITKHPLVGEADPHLWLSPKLLKEIGESLAESIANLLPDKAKLIYANLDNLTRKLTSLDKRLKKRLLGKKTVEMLVWHDAWAYFRKDFALPEAVMANASDIHEGGISVRRALAIRELLKSYENGCLVVSSKVVLDNEAQMLVEDTGTAIAFIDASGFSLPARPESLFRLLELSLAAHLSCSAAAG